MYHYQTMNFINFLDKDNTEPENCTEKEIMLYLAHLQKQGMASETRKLRLIALRHFFNFQIETGKRKNNPTTRIKLQGGQKQKLYPILSPQELQNIYESNYVDNNASVEGVAENLATFYLLYGDVNLINTEIEMYRTITREEIREAAKKYLNPNQRLILDYVPAKDKAQN